MVDIDGNVTYWDRGAETLFGHPASDVLGRPVDVIVPPAYRDAHWAGFHHAIATGRSKLHGLATNLPTLHADGSERVLPAGFVFLTEPPGVAVGAMAIYAEAAGGEEPWTDTLPRPGAAGAW